MARSPRFIRIILFCFAPFRRIFRIEVIGLDAIPECPCLLVANHSIGAAFEIVGLLDAWERYFATRGGRPAYGLAHRLAFRIPLLSAVMKRVGAIPATFEDARRAFASGGTVLVFPGGNWEATRSFKLGNAVDFHGHRGWIRVAREAGVPIVPVAISGSYAINPVLGRSRSLAILSLFDFFLGIRWIPITIGQFFWAALFFSLTASRWSVPATILGTFFVFMFTPLFPIWPAKISIKIGNPVSAAGQPDDTVGRRIKFEILNSFVKDSR